MGLFDLLEKETEVKEPQKEEIKDAEVVEKETAVNELEKEVKEEPKKEVKKKTKTSKTKTTKNEKAGYLYPFNIYSEGCLIDIDSYGFEEGKAYQEDEITKIMLAHKHYEFAGTMEYSFIKDDNVLVVNAKQHKKG